MRFLSYTVLLAASLATKAAPAVRQVTALSADQIASKAAQGLSLLQFAKDAEPEWHTEGEKIQFMRDHVNFMDVTYTYDRKQKLAAQKVVPDGAKATFPAPSHQSKVNAIISTVSIDKMKSYLSGLTAFKNRYYKSSTGGEASQYILDTVNKIISGRGDISASLFAHSWTQSSIIAKLAGADPSAPVTIVGSHMDSINLSNPSNGAAPGADDDGTGSVNLLEALRVLVTAGYKPATPVEFHWYSGEEAGLLGSQDIATSYKKRGVKVKAFMEMDMSGYFKPGTTEVFALEADYIDKGLNSFLGKLIDEYAAFGWTMDTPCGYACSDHASWEEQGYPTTFPYEAVTGNDNPNVHSATDTVNVKGFSWNHVLEFGKIVVAFVYELAPSL